jgi:uncharacterized protein (DUF983 family)
MAAGTPSRLAAIRDLRCPRCLRGRVFPRGWRQLNMYYACPECGVVFGRENGYFTGAMIVSYLLAVPLLALLTVVIWLITGWRFDLILLIGMLYFLPFVPAIFRYSRVIWMHFDRVVDPTLESEHYVER